MKKVIFMGLLLFISILLFGCDKEEAEFSNDSVILLIKGEYREKFDTEGFTIDDFEWENAEKFYYGSWYEKSYVCHFTLILKSKGRKQVLDAIKHCKTLDFVQCAEINPIIKTQDI